MTNSVLKQMTPGGTPFYATQTATATDSVSSQSSTANVCGNYIYSVSSIKTTAVQSLSTSELTIDSNSGLIQIYTANFNTVGTHTATVTVSLVGYPAISSIITFIITINHICTTTSITTAPASIENLVTFAGTSASSKLKYTFNDTVSVVWTSNTDA
jgi:hypothetical protein